METICFYAPESTLERLDALAHRAGRSRSNMTLQLVEAALSQPESASIAPPPRGKTAHEILWPNG